MTRAAIKQTLIDSGVTEVSGALLDALSAPTPQAGGALTASGNDVLRELAGQIDDDLITGIGHGYVIAQGRAMDLLEAMRAALSTTPTMSAEDMREAAAQAGYRVCAETRHVSLGDKVSTAIRSLPLTKEPSQ